MSYKNWKNLKIIIPGLLFVVFLFLGFYFSYYNYKKTLLIPEKKLPTEVQKEQIKKPVVSQEADFINLDAPFITQAPFRLWSVHPFNHTCEEASVLMVHYYLTGRKTVDENTTKEELLSMVDFQDKKYGFSNDTNTEQTARFIRDYYGYDVKVFYDISLNDIKKELNKGNLVIIPAAGRLLLNPYFTPPGPVYHMLLIKGYNATGFIVHDPGTYRTGADYEYSYEVLENAIHDFNQDTGLADGRKAMIIISLPDK